MFRIGLAILIFIYSLPALAEYRAYQLSVVNATTGTESTIISTLDHLQYREFYPLNAGDEIFYVDSWRCHGNTKNFKPICPKPEAQRNTAGTD